MEEKKFKVIKILDDYAILINNNHFFHLGDTVKIYSEGEELFDSEGKSYGKLKLVKDILIVTVCEDKYIICKKVVIEKKNRLLPVLDQFATETIKKEIKLNVDKEQIESIIYETDEPIKIGDFAVKV